jgi:hypothetical protein
LSSRERAASAASMSITPPSVASPSRLCEENWM